MPDITYDVGRVSFVMKGAWNLATSYEKLDAVSYNGSLYIAKQDVPGGTAITNTTYWQLAAEKGDKGDTGGVDSVNGQQGDVWFPDSRQLISDGYTTDTDPFLMKGNDSDSDRFELAKKLGNTVAVNQLVNPAKLINSSGTGWTMTANADGTLTLVVTTAITSEVGVLLTLNSSSSYIKIPDGHKYIIFGTNTRPGDSVWRNGYSGAYLGWNTVSTQSGTGNFLLQIALRNVPVGTYTIRPLISDWSIWYGSTDRIPSDLLSHPENWGRYYAGSLDYNAGTLESADGTVLKSIGRNVWDEEIQNGYYNPAGVFMPNASYVATKNKIPVIPNTAYHWHCGNSSGGFGRICFYDANEAFLYTTTAGGNKEFNITSPNGAYYVVFDMQSTYGAVYHDDITISLYYSGESGYSDYYPYSVLAEVDTGSEVLRSAGAVADEKTPDGTITRRVGVVDLGTLTWTGGSGRFSAYLATSIEYSSANNVYPSLKCPKYVSIVSYDWYHQNLTGISHSSYGYGGAHYILINDTSYSDVATLKSALSGVYLYYELATPTTEQGTAFEPLVATVKGGVLSWTNTKGIPVGHESHYFENLRKRVEDRLPDPPSADGTYRLTCTISGGVKTYSWEA